MGILDSWLIYRFIKTLTTPWDEWNAFKTGVIDGNGKVIKSTSRTQAQKDSYTLFDKLVANIKRMIEKLGGSRKIATYAAALFLIKEQCGDDEGMLVLERSFMKYLKENDAVDPNYLEEQYLPEEMLAQGNYKLNNSMLDTKGNSLEKGTLVVAPTNLQPLSRVLGVNVYKLQVAHTGKVVVVSHEDIHEI